VFFSRDVLILRSVIRHELRPSTLATQRQQVGIHWIHWIHWQSLNNVTVCLGFNGFVVRILVYYYMFGRVSGSLRFKQIYRRVTLGFIGSNDKLWTCHMSDHVDIFCHMDRSSSPDGDTICFFWPRRFNQENVMRSTHPKAFTPNVFDLLDVFKVDSVSAISGGHFSWSYANFVLRHWVTYLEMHLNSTDSTLNIPDKCSTNLSYTNNLPKRSCHRVCRWLQKLSNGFSTHRLPRNASPLVQGTMKSAKSLPHFWSTAAVNSLVDLQMSRLSCALHANLVYSTMLMELERQSRQQKHNCK
jgi:hypothetical protein